MKKTSEKIVFFGSGPVAARSLELLSADFNIEAVITKPAKTRKNDPVPVVDLANKLGLKIFLPTNRQELNELIKTSPVDSKMAILIDYGIIVSQEVIDYFPLGIINSHFSLLPKLRGADPITFSILSGDPITGVSLMLINAGMDEGLLLKQAALEISNNATTVSLTSDLINLSNDLLKEVVPKYVDGEVKPYPQPSEIEPTYSRKLTKLDGQIDWSKSAEQIEREIRAYIDWPKSYTELNDKDIIITKASIKSIKGKQGSYLIKNGELIFYCGEDALSVERIKPSGKNEMSIKEFLTGYRSISK